MLEDPYDPVLVTRMLDASWVHKLTYKVDRAALERDSVIARLVSDGPAG